MSDADRMAGEGGANPDPVAARHTRARLTAPQRHALEQFELTIRELLLGGAVQPGAGDAPFRSVVLDPDVQGAAVFGDKARRHIKLTAAVLKYLVREGLTGREYRSDLAAFALAGGAHWIFQHRADPDAAAPGTFAAAVLRAAGLGPGD